MIKVLSGCHKSERGDGIKLHQSMLHICCKVPKHLQICNKTLRWKSQTTGLILALESTMKHSKWYCLWKINVYIDFTLIRRRICLPHECRCVDPGTVVGGSYFRGDNWRGLVKVRISGPNYLGIISVKLIKGYQVSINRQERVMVLNCFRGYYVCVQLSF